MSDAHNYREHHYRSADGRLNLFARDYPGVEGQGGDDLPLLLMHGLTRNSADFEPMIGLLGAGQRRMIVPDQRGRGLSDYDSDPSNYRPEIYVADMWALLDDLAVDRAICVGTSMGGLMAMLMAGQNPNRVAGIVLNDIGPEVSEEGLDRIRSYVGPSNPLAGWAEAAAKCKAINASALEGFTQSDWLAFAERTCRELPDGSVEFAYDSAISSGLEQDNTTSVPPDLWPLWDALIDIPILAIRGAHSDILTPASLQEMARRRKGDLAAVEVPGRGHAPILDEPVAIVALRDFLGLRE
ncbi:MAG: alpha/beta hydrolase [Erythrobacter sp.]